MTSEENILEPILDDNAIQGNILSGFNKDHQTLLGFMINDVEKGHQYIQTIVKEVSTLNEVFQFNKLYKTLKQRLEKEPSNLSATWLNIAFSYNGMKKMIGNITEIEPFLDSSFVKGLPSLSLDLGDPSDLQSDGNYHNWKVGSPTNIPDLLLIVASDDLSSLQKKNNHIIEISKEFGIDNFYQETGHDLSYYHKEKRGQEHFGFKDGISQPGVRGKLSSNSSQYITSRPENQQSDTNLPEVSTEGRPLIAPGEFVIGYPTQNANNLRGADPVETSFPEVLIGGSYLVYRRLRQDVSAFEKFIEMGYNQLSTIEGFTAITKEKFKSMIVGRWPSGAPLSLSPQKDNPQLGKDKEKNNLFGYADDENGFITPVTSHIRKVNPRDQTTDQGGPSRALKRRILRRGIPYGAPYDSSISDSQSIDRGLLFLSYQESIIDQFEFLVTNWINSISLPTNAPSPNGNDSGYDMLMGQNSNARTRFSYYQVNVHENTVEAKIKTDSLNILDWVTPTGGGYFFSPSIKSLKSFF